MLDGDRVSGVGASGSMGSGANRAVRHRSGVNGGARWRGVQMVVKNGCVGCTVEANVVLSISAAQTYRRLLAMSPAEGALVAIPLVLVAAFPAAAGDLGKLEIYHISFQLDRSEVSCDPGKCMLLIHLKSPRLPMSSKA